MKKTQLLTNYTIWFSQSEVVLHSNLEILSKQDKECSGEWLVNIDPVLEYCLLQTELYRLTYCWVHIQLVHTLYMYF